MKKTCPYCGGDGSVGASETAHPVTCISCDGTGEVEDKTINNPSDGAFPCEYRSGVFQHGMTLRQWYAGQALAGVISDPIFPTDGTQDEKQRKRRILVAAYVFEYADAMIAHEANEKK